MLFSSLVDYGNFGVLRYSVWLDFAFFRLLSWPSDSYRGRGQRTSPVVAQDTFRSGDTPPSDRHVIYNSTSYLILPGVSVGLVILCLNIALVLVSCHNLALSGHRPPKLQICNACHFQPATPNLRILSLPIATLSPSVSLQIG